MQLVKKKRTYTISVKERIEVLYEFYMIRNNE